MRTRLFHTSLGLWLLMGTLAEAATSFTDVSTNLIGLTEGWLEWGDYNNDGRLDLLADGLEPLGTPHTFIYSNAGNGLFVSMPTTLPQVTFGRCLWGDYDNDGRLDILIGPTGEVFHNDGNGVFTLAASVPNVNGGPVAWGDFDNDGKLDVVATDANGYTTIYRNTGTNFAVWFTIFYPLNVGAFSSISVGDLDNDGWLDLLVTPVIANGYQTFFFRNLGDGTFANLGGLLPGVVAGASPLADFDNDGKLDLLLAGSGFANVYRNLGTNAYQSIASIAPGIVDCGAAWGDFDNDGRLDLWLSGLLNNKPFTGLYRNTTGGFVDSGLSLPGLYYAAVAWGDFDNDGDLDVACLGWNDNSVGTAMHIFRNDGTVSNAPPTAPTGLSAVQSGNLVTLSWQAASDPNQAGGLSYNVRIGTNPGGIDVLSPMANPATGWRLVARSGNAGQRLFAIFKLPPGANYYWSVQAIDNSFAGSPFATEAAFHIDTAPVISAISDQMIRFSSSTPPLPFSIGDFEAPADQLILTASSSNPNLVRPDGILLDGSGSNRIVTVTPVPLRVGTSVIALVVADPQGRTASNSFLVSVTNLPPTISHSSNLRVRPNSPVGPIAFVVGDAETPATDLALTFAFSNTNLVPGYLPTGSGSNRVLSLTLKPDQRGTCLISVIVTDPVSASATNAFTFQVGDFDLVASGLPNVIQGGVEWGDFNNDGKLDVLIWGNVPGAAICRIYRNDGASGFTDIAAGFPGVSDGIARWGDYDNDGYLDVLVASGTSQRVYRNNHDGTFTNIGAALGTGRLLTGGWVDYNNDGRLDILISSSTGTRLFRNNGDGTFTNSGIVLPATVNGSAAWSDYDGDGDLDLALSGISGVQDKQGPGTAIYRNEGNGVFTDINAGLQAVSQGSLAWGDWDQDGRPDLLLTGINGNNYFTRIYHNNDDDTFNVVATNLVNVEVGVGVWGDVDNDGDLDIFLTGLAAGPAGRTALIYRNDGNGAFKDTGEPLAGTYWSGAAWGDYDGDGVLDLLYCGTTNGLSSGAGTMLLRNTLTRTNTAPAAPTGLALLPNQVLSWNPAHDLETTNASGLTYDLRIGTSSGGMEVLAPAADLATGKRRVARLGAVGAGARWRADLPYGTYYWSVQAVDTAFAGSPFAPEASFTVTNLRPVLSAITNPTVSMISNLFPIPILVGDFESDAGLLTLTAASANTNLVSAGNGVFTGSGSNRTLVIVPQTNRTGSARITVTVTDPGGLSSSESFVLNVTNYPPAISRILDQHTGLAHSTPPIPFTVSDIETPAGNLVLSASSSNTNLLPLANIVFGGSGSNRTVTLAPVGPNPGTISVTVTVTDSFGATTSTNFVLTVERFSLVAANLIPATRGGLAWGDFDNDGQLDLVISGQNTTILDAQAVLYRNVAGTFVAALTNGGNWVDSSVAWADYNQDGWLDLGVMGRNTGVALFPNTQNGAFANPGGFGLLAHSGSMAWGDVDNDGDPDLLVTGATGVVGVSVATLFRNDSAVFWYFSIGFLPVSGGSGTFADFDNDGDLDVLLTGLPVGATNGITRLYRNDGGMVFTELPLGLPGLYNSAAAWADYDNDGWPDFVVCGATGTNILTLLFHNNHDGTFSPINSGLPGVQLGSVAWGDFDNDGFADLLLTGTTNGAASGAITRIYRNNHDGTFSDLLAGLPGVYSGTAACGDFDNDGRLDVVLMGSSGSTFFSRIYRNSNLISNTPPQAPSGLTASLQPGRANLAWLAASDAETTNGLSYNLRVGRSPGGNDILPSHSALNGWRRLPAVGNAGEITHHTLLDLAPGTFYWSVQAVDAAWAGSAFAPEQAFTITNFSPAASAFNVTTPEDSLLFLFPTSTTNDAGQSFTFNLRSGPAHGTLSNTPDGQMTYQPATNYFGIDSFQFQASAGTTSLPPAIVTITVTPVQDAPEVRLALQRASGNNLDLLLRGEPYARYRIEYSSDLRQWHELTVAQTSVSGSLSVTTSVDPAGPRFFRAHLAQ